MTVQLLAVIAGGKSHRFGRDKTQLEISGVTLLERICAIGIDAGYPVAVIGRDQPEAWPVRLSAVGFHRDERPGLGPLGGLCTALTIAVGSVAKRSVIAVAADLPAFDGQSLDWLHSLDAAPATVRARIPRHNADPSRTDLEPLCALYRPTILAAIRARLDRGDLALHHLVDEPGVETVEAPTWLHPRLVNINTPDDWDGYTAENTH